ncbi:Protein serine threonine phosphatase 2C [Rhizoctonia solani]|uniref:Protein serine threonine phosphatase 2C n=1 Tax=Rhizoctonia solani TaxID=456999 RepID=A0A8H7IBF7_9AGAM|nr:Protein serine threonine phosphatase 2C [Rhizoctonia solani]
MSHLAPFTVTKASDGRLLTNLSIEGHGSPWNFRMLAEPELTQELLRHANPKSSNASDLRVDSVWFQPAQGEENASQDRVYAGTCEIDGEKWSLAGVFDGRFLGFGHKSSQLTIPEGHAGEECAEYAINNFPEYIKRALSGVRPKEDISSRLVDAFASFDDSIIQPIRDLFPDPDALASIPDEQLEAMVNDHACGGGNYEKIILAMRGTTAVISLVDPSRKNLWVAGVGDSRAVLGIKRPDGSWLARDLIVQHNGGNESELQAVRDAHPNEPEITLRNRVLGAIAVTRAKPGFRVHSSVEAFTTRNVTPPYLSAIPDIAHVELAGDSEENEQESIQKWVELVGSRLDSKDWAINGPDNLALPVLRAVYSGSNNAHLSAFLTLESDSKWLDDTSIQVVVL